MKLVHHRDAGMMTYTWFYVNDTNHCVSPFFDTEKEAIEWFDKVFGDVDEY